MMMPVSGADLEQLRSMIATVPNHDAPDLSALESVEELLGFLVADARSRGADEADMVEMFVRLAELSPDDVRAAQRVLAALGYRAVAARLKELAGRRKHTLRPLS
jgi:hypothetical protein